MRKLPHMPAGPGRNCRPNLSGIVQPMARRKAPSAIIRGVTPLLIRAGGTFITRVGIPWRSIAIRQVRARLACSICSETVGSGLRHRSLRFQPFSFYPGYSADFFDGKHFVMKGGSPRTDACMLRRSFRNWFQPHYPYVYATFRCVEE